MARRGDILKSGTLWQRNCAEAISSLGDSILALETLVGANTLASGVYTPTATIVVNVAAATSYQAQYSRVGSVVTVSGKVDITPSAAGSVAEVGLSLPIASNLGANEDCGGSAATVNIFGEAAAVIADATNDRARVRWIPGTTSSCSFFYSYAYRII
jgi:hypothetical protein